MSTPMGKSYFYELFKKGVEMSKGKHVSFPAQREQCRLNKFTYTEKCSCGIITLMCNYPFDDPKHKKGVCRASTCTDMRKTLAEDVEAIANEETLGQGVEKVTSVVGADEAKLTEAQPGAEGYVAKIADGKVPASKPAMKPEDIAKSA
jgi:hypothetical protein